MTSAIFRSTLLFLVTLLAAQAKPLPRSSPEEQGIPSSAILKFVQAAEKDIDALHSIMVVRHGQVVAEGWWAPYSKNSPHSLYSLSKSFTSTAIGMLVAERKMSIHDLVLPYFPEYTPARPSKQLKVMRVRDLLIMSSGQASEAPIWRSKEPWAKVFLNHPVPHWPGTHFRYNSPGSFMLSAIAQKITGQTLLDYLKPRLFEPLGIENPTWATNWEGISRGAGGLNLHTEDITKFGQLYLQKGVWNGQQLIPIGWIKNATSLQTSSGNDPVLDRHQGYGYQFWIGRHHTYYGVGAFGQICLIMPEQDAVIAITAGVKDVQSVMNLVWRYILPAMQPSALPANFASHQQLKTKLNDMSLPTLASKPITTQPAKYNNRTYTFPANDQGIRSLKLTTQTDGSATLNLRYDDRSQTIVSFPQLWMKTLLSYGKISEGPTAVTGAWTQDNTYTLKLCRYETPYTLTIKMKFEGDKIHYYTNQNVSFGSPKSSHLVGESR